MFRLLQIAIPIIMLAVTFQNCSGGMQGSSESKLSSFERSNNGDSYTGKIYQDLALDGSCGGANVKSQIELVGEGQGMLVRENCQDITPRLIAVDDLMPHNRALLSHSKSLFQMVDGTDKITGLLCRGETINTTDGIRNVADATIYFSASDPGNLQGNVLVGQYSLADGSLLRTLNALDKPVERMAQGSMGFVFYRSPNENGTYAFFLNTHPDSQGELIGNLTYVVTPGSGPGGPPPETVVLQGMSCKSM